MKWFVILTLALALTVACASAQISGTKHDLSTGGGGTLKSTDEDQICIFCHTPHHASATQTPLWNRSEVTTAYPTYDSPTINAYSTIPNVSGSSLLCLSCHDGITALNSLLYTNGGTPTMAGGITLITGNSDLVDAPGLTNDHPVSFAYEDAITNGDLELTATGSLPNWALEGDGKMQCSSCHDVHDNTYGPFLNIANTSSALCLTCHIK